MPRIWVYNEMKDMASLQLLVGSRIFPSTKVDKAPSTKPFIMFRQTSDVDFMRGDDGDQVRSAGYLIFAHDNSGDYMRIDTMISLLQMLFKDTIDQAAGIIRSRWAETSGDQRDDDMGTIFKYASIQVFYKV